MTMLTPELRDRLSSMVTALGYEFVGCEIPMHGRHSMTLRIYIDSHSGITIDDCVKVSHHVGAVLDAEDLIQRRYQLEISSPGLDRPLFEKKQYEKQMGRRIKVRLRMPIQNRRHYVGVLSHMTEDHVCLLLDSNEEMRLPFADIEKARVCG